MSLIYLLVLCLLAVENSGHPFNVVGWLEKISLVQTAMASGFEPGQLWGVEEVRWG